MKDYEKKLLKFTLSEKIKGARTICGSIMENKFYGNSYFFGRVSDSFFDDEKIGVVSLNKIINESLLNLHNEIKLEHPNYNITKDSDTKLTLANFKLDDNEVSVNYKYFKMFEKDVCYIFNYKYALYLYDENKSFIGLIALVNTNKD